MMPLRFDKHRPVKRLDRVLLGDVVAATVAREHEHLDFFVGLDARTRLEHKHAVRREKCPDTAEEGNARVVREEVADGSEAPLAPCCSSSSDGLCGVLTPRLATYQTDGVAFALAGVAPNDLSGEALELRFSGPGAGAATASLGEAVSPFTNGPQEISAIVVPSGANLVDLNLPIDPNGVVYDADSMDQLWPREVERGRFHFQQ